MRIKRKFFRRNADIVAKELLGKRLVRVFADGSKKSAIITETEAYLGIEDKAAHSYGGRRTKRTEVMFGKAGVLYVPFTYGIHWMLNIVVSEPGNPQAILIRGTDAVSGPGKLTKYMGIDGSFYGEDLVKSKRIRIENVEDGGKCKIESTQRIGINYAKDWIDKPLRFLLRKK